MPPLGFSIMAIFSFLYKCIGQYFAPSYLFLILSRVYCLRQFTSAVDVCLMLHVLLCLLFFLNLFCIIWNTIDANDQKKISSACTSEWEVNLRCYVSYIRSAVITNVVYCQLNIVHCNTYVHVHVLFLKWQWTRL